MSKEIESIASALFDKIRSRFPGVVIRDETGNKIDDAENAKRFTFVYSTSDGTKFGAVSISLADEESLKVSFPTDIKSKMGRDQRREWSQFLRNLRQFAMSNILDFDVRDIAKPALTKKDIKQNSKVSTVATTADVPVTESKLYGSMMQSRFDMDETRLRIHHSSMVSDDIHGDRSRKINQIFIETAKGERFLLEFNNLGAAKAMCRHVNEGGDIHDEIGKCITRMVREMSAMKHFVRSTKNRQFEDEETSTMTHHAVDHYMQLKNTLRHLANKRHYQEFVESYVPEEETTDTHLDVNSLRERFVKKFYDERFDEALPIINRIHERSKHSQYAEELDEWATTILEDDQTDQLDALQRLMKSSVKTGEDGIDAKTDMENMFPGENLTELLDVIGQYATDHGPDADCRPVIKTWLNGAHPDMLAKIDIGRDGIDDASTNHVLPISPKQAHPNDTYGSTSLDDPVTDPNIPTTMQEDSLDFLRSLAGLKR